MSEFKTAHPIFTGDIPMLDKFKAWYAKPYSSDQSVTGWALFVLMLVCISVFWKLILGHVISAAD